MGRTCKIEDPIIKNLFIVALLLTSVAADARGEAVKSIRLILPPQSDPVVERIGRVFTRQVQNRCDTKVVAQGDAPLTVELAIEPDISEEGFKIADGGNGTIRIIGNDARGLLYGVGHNTPPLLSQLVELRLG